MDEALRETLGDEITHAFEELTNLTPGTEDYERAVNSACKMYSTMVEDIKIEENLRIEGEASDKDATQKEKELKSKNIEKLIDVGLGVLKFAASTAFTTAWLKTVLTYEKENVVTTKIFGPLMKFILPKNMD